MSTRDFEARVVERGKAFFSTIENEKPSLFDKGRWIGKVMDWSMRDERFKVNMFRFVDVFPSLNTSKLLMRHIKEYFPEEDPSTPMLFKWGVKVASVMGAGFAVGPLIKSNIASMAKQFIIGENTRQAIKSLKALRQEGFAFVVDLLGEATVNEDEAEQYVATFLELLDKLAREQDEWSPLPGKFGSENSLDWGYAPKVQISVKPSALYSDIKPASFERSVEKIVERLAVIYERIVALKGAMCIDMESTKYKDITIEAFKRLRSDKRFRHYPHLGIVLQAYLKDTSNDLDCLLQWAKEEQLPIEIRLVKGAYWDYETVVARQNTWDSPVWQQKSETDAAFEKLARKILENNDICYFACGSHNIRSIAAVMEMAKVLGVEENRYEFQLLYGMAEPVRKAVLKNTSRVRLYCPYGEMVPGMAYLVRRLLENTANESFLRQSFMTVSDKMSLLQDPSLKVEPRDKPDMNPRERFRTEPAVDFTLPGVREHFENAIADVRANIGKTYPLYIDGEEIHRDKVINCINPNNTEEILGYVCEANINDVNAAVKAASGTFPMWRATSPEARAEYLFKAADVARHRVYHLSAWQVLATGKQWDQAYADVTEAIDFLDYYAHEMLRLSKPQRLGNLPGELNQLFYEGKGVAAIIAPWNFPLAISMGMVAAALVSGNTVVYKPSELSPIIGNNLSDIFRSVGLPRGVFNFVPGYGKVIGDHLVDHPDVALIGFTGSKAIGLRILERAAKVHLGQKGLKKVICEMGGKNAIIVDDDADLDEVVPQVLYSAFGYQGQKCSACSRLIVLGGIYEKLMDRLVKALQDKTIGNPENPAHFMGALIDKVAQQKTLKYQEIASKEGKIIFKTPEENIPRNGYYVPIMVVEGITPKCRIAQEEVFGPILAVMRVKDFNQALEWANASEFALTGGVFSRSPENLEKAKKEFRVGNLYLNRGCTGALVGRQAFGGFHMSGAGTKAGGPDYLLNFMDPRLITENTMRRGFTPEMG